MNQFGDVYGSDGGQIPVSELEEGSIMLLRDVQKVREAALSSPFDERRIQGPRYQSATMIRSVLESAGPGDMCETAQEEKAETESPNQAFEAT